MEFIHVADVHLGATPDVGCSWSRSREQEIWDSFRRLIEKVAKQEVDLLLIAGDLFHGQPLMRQLREVAALLEQIPKTQVVMIAGNHDCIKKGSNYRSIDWPPNVIGLWEEECQGCYLEKINTCIYGFSYGKKEITQPIYNQIFSGGKENLLEEYPEAIHILLAHGGDDKHVPIHYKNLGKTDFDYIALGHIHQPEIIIPDQMAYSGSLEPLDKNHIGQRGYIRGRITEEGTTIKFIPFSSRQYEYLKIPVTPDSTNTSLVKAIQEQIAPNPDWIYRVQLEGYRNPETIFSEDQIKTAGNIIEVVDQTVPEYDFAQMMDLYAGTVLGEYIKTFLNPNSHKGETLSAVEEKALYYGVQALLEARE